MVILCQDCIDRLAGYVVPAADDFGCRQHHLFTEVYHRGFVLARGTKVSMERTVKHRKYAHEPARLWRKNDRLKLSANADKRWSRDENGESVQAWYSHAILHNRSNGSAESTWVCKADALPFVLDGPGVSEHTIADAPKIASWLIEQRREAEEKAERAARQERIERQRDETIATLAEHGVVVKPSRSMFPGGTVTGNVTMSLVEAMALAVRLMEDSDA